MQKNNRPGAGQRNSRSDQINKLPPPQPVTYYQDGRLNSALMDSQAEAVAKGLQELSTTQLRRFYGDVLTLRQRLKAEQGRGREAEAELLTQKKIA